MFSLETSTLYVSSHYAAEMFNYSCTAELCVNCAVCTQNVFLITVSTSLSCKIGVIVGADGVEVSLRTAILQGPLCIYKTVITGLESGSQLVQVNNEN